MNNYLALEYPGLLVRCSEYAGHKTAVACVSDSRLLGAWLTHTGEGTWDREQPAKVFSVRVEHGFAECTLGAAREPGCHGTWLVFLLPKLKGYLDQTQQR